MAKTFEGVIFDKDFVLSSELRALGFRKSDIDNEYLRIQDWVHADAIELFDDDLAEAKRDVSTWKHKIKGLLSRPVGKYAHKKRPNRNLLPMMNSEELRNSVKVSLKGSKGKVWEYELKVNIKSKHADFTNDNITRAGRNKRKVSWRGWADEMMDGKGLKGVPSARNLMRSLFR